MTGVLRVATRRSPLALAQAGLVASELAAATGRESRLVPVTTAGDRESGPLDQLGGSGVFVGAVRQALIDGTADVAVHSLKDLPTANYPGVLLAAIPERADARDALCARAGATLDQLPPGSAIGTGAPRRAAQLTAARPDLRVVPVRGNVDTRLRQVTESELDGVVLASAGLSRLGRQDAISQLFGMDVMLPAAGQGALAVEARADVGDADPELAAALSTLDDSLSRAAVTAERTLLAALEAGCTAPVGAFAEVADSSAPAPTLVLHAVACSATGSQTVRMSAAGRASEARGVGERLAADLLAHGAASLLGETRT